MTLSGSPESTHQTDTGRPWYREATSSSWYIHLFMIQRRPRQATWCIRERTHDLRSPLLPWSQFSGNLWSESKIRLLVSGIIKHPWCQRVCYEEREAMWWWFSPRGPPFRNLTHLLSLAWHFLFLSFCLFLRVWPFICLFILLFLGCTMRHVGS